MAAAFLAELGLDEMCSTKFLNAFDSDDIAAAKKSFLVTEPLSGERVLASPIQRAHVQTWLRDVRAADQVAAFAPGPVQQPRRGPPPSEYEEQGEPVDLEQPAPAEFDTEPTGTARPFPIAPPPTGPTPLPSVA